MDEWVTKPFTRKELNEVLQQWLPEQLIMIEASESIKTTVSTESLAIDIGFLQQNFNFDDPDDMAFIAALQRAFQESADSTFSALQYSIDTHHAEQIRQLAHGLKSISSNVGAMHLSDLCKTMEQAGKTQQLKNVSTLLTDMKLEYSKALSELNHILSRATTNLQSLPNSTNPNTEHRFQSLIHSRQSHRFFLLTHGRKRIILREYHLD